MPGRVAGATAKTTASTTASTTTVTPVTSRSCSPAVAAPGAGQEMRALTSRKFRPGLPTGLAGSTLTGVATGQ
jgi:hypothetical protein